jgi:hypothetical protein
MKSYGKYEKRIEGSLSFPFTTIYDKEGALFGFYRGVHQLIKTNTSSSKLSLKVPLIIPLSSSLKPLLVQQIPNDQP